ncbi:alpha/beta hydrolase fold domain-containing protein [Allosaccharopolyspora coralli]|uniref:Alpha/beta hydrolase fold domain-containing protein n=1 Tax=Allosaccharopolyspora coralli TaxID=2665642 RepID=A0A5Q3Q1G2_9PSEU|nr:alpha/beta hydrolase [Allosaccharopolyspora coralli]QGK68371.1 alpha/beta hydrolase fold domain-containing protein [Allosaccharopolyspora coralli]
MLQTLTSVARSTTVEGTVLRCVLGLPHGVKRALARAPIVVDGQELALDAQLLLRLQQLSGQTGLTGSDVGASRALMRRSAELLGHTPITDVEITERHVPTPSGSLPTRLYRPHSVTDTSDLLVFYHGGGWVIGDLDSHDDLCRFLATRADVRVLSVDYRLAPENPFPAAAEDALAAFRHAVEHADELGTTRERISVGGDSAGGNLAAVVAHHTTRNDTTAPKFQLLLYPVVDATTRRQSRELFSNGFLLTDEDMDWFMGHYEPEGARRGDLLLSVLLAEDLTDLPPAHVVTAGFDPLRDEGEEYVRRLRQSDVRVVHRRFADLIHGFANLRLAGGRFHEAMVEVAATLRAALQLR